MKQHFFWIFGLCLCLILANYWWVFQYTPLELSQGIVQKIMYIHVPSIFTAYLFLTLVFIGSLGYLLKNRLSFDQISQAAAEVGVLNLIISLVTGSIWGKPTWNTFWTWDARLTVTLVMFLLYLGYLLFRKLGDYSEKIKIGSALIGILGFFSIPLNHLAVRWFRSLHQPSTLFAQKEKIDVELYYPLLSSIFCFIFVSFCLFWTRLALEKQKTKYNTEHLR